jgi:hypothetical protein
MATAKLDNWRVEELTTLPYFVIWGNVYEDERERFRDGLYMHTSGIPITELSCLRKGYVVTTRNSTYELGEPYVDE